jgi:hypothetical protein
MSDLIVEIFNFITAVIFLGIMVIGTLVVIILLWNISFDIANNIYVLIKNFLI